MKNKVPDSTRRKFISDISKVTAAGIFLASPLTSFASSKNWTVGEVMDLFINETTRTAFPQTVDTLKSGNRDIVITGIVTAMFATIPVIRQAIALGANFIIAHEPTFYNHLDRTDWLESNETYQYKKKLLADSNIAIWRNHDYIHSHRPDGVYAGTLAQLGWATFALPAQPWNVEIPPVTLSTLISHVKEKLGIKTLRYIGETSQLCKKVLLMPGAAGGERQIRSISDTQPDVAIVGEVQEWETAEYIRDARASGKNISLLVLGHIDSENGGSAYMKDWLNKNVPGIQATHLNSINPFTFG
jgi:putative NIF3 family GTP cyclohydrolase 1 type 2